MRWLIQKLAYYILALITQKVAQTLNKLVKVERSRTVVGFHPRCAVVRGWVGVDDDAAVAAAVIAASN